MALATLRVPSLNLGISNTPIGPFQMMVWQVFKFWAKLAAVSGHEIPLPTQPRTGIAMAALKSGTSLNTIPTHAELRYEIRSESAEMVEQVHQQVVHITEELSARTQAAVQLDVFAHREPGGG